MGKDRLPLDQARHPYTASLARTVQGYEEYLLREYEENYGQKGGWQTHFREMRSAIADCLLDGIERGTSPKRKEMNVALVGPGFKPVGRDLDHARIDDYFRNMRSIVVVDFSRKVLRSAIQDLMQANVDSEILYPMELDITHGYSTAYDRWLEEKLKYVETEEQLHRATEDFEKFTMADLEDMQLRLIEESEYEVLPPVDEYLEGGENVSGGMGLSVAGKPLPLHAVILLMITSGTGAAAEARFWERYWEVVQSREEPVTDAVETARKEMFKRVHSMISEYNTEITAEYIRSVFAAESNRDATVLSIADVATTHMQPRFGEMPRVNLRQLEDKMDSAGIDTTFMRKWNWADEPEHLHPVSAIEFRLKKKPRTDEISQINVPKEKQIRR